MALGDILFATGFETSALMDLSTAAPTVTGGTCATVTTQKNTGGQSLRINKTAAGSCFVGLGNSSNGIQPASTITKLNGSFWLRIAALPTGTMAPVFLMQDGAGSQYWAIAVDGDGQVYCSAFGGSGFGGTSPTSAGTMSTNTWYLIEWSINWVSGTTCEITIRMNGGTSTTHTDGVAGTSAPFWGWLGSNIALTYASNSFNGGFVLGTPTTAARYDMFIDDFTIFDMVGSSGVWTGDLRVPAIFPDRSVADIDSTWTMVGGDGTHRASTMDECITPGTAPDGATSYMQTIVAATVQRCDMTTYALAGGTCKGATLVGSIGSTGTTAAAMTVTLQNSAGTDSTVTSSWNGNVNGFKSPGGQVAFKQAPGAVAWTQSPIDGVRFKVTNGTVTTPRRISTLALYLVVTPPVAQPVENQINQAVGSRLRLSPHTLDAATYRKKRR